MKRPINPKQRFSMRAAYRWCRRFYPATGTVVVSTAIGGIACLVFRSFGMERTGVHAISASLIAGAVLIVSHTWPKAFPPERNH